MEGCVFCKKIQEGSEIIYNDGIFAAQFDRFPIVPGHAELFPVEHIADIENMDSIEHTLLWHDIEDLIELINKTDLEVVYRKMIESPLNEISRQMCEYMLSKPYIKEPITEYNFGCNNGRSAGRTVDHLHFHIIPRHAGDVPDPVGGIRHMIPGMGNYRTWKKPE